MAFINETTVGLILPKFGSFNFAPFVAAESLNDLMIANDSVTTKVTAAAFGRLYSSPEVKSDGASNTTLKINLAALKDANEDLFNALHIKYSSDTNLGSLRQVFSGGREVVYTSLIIMETPAQYTNSAQFIDVQFKFEK